MQIAELQCEIKLLEANIEGLKGNLKDVLESEAKAHELNTRLQFQMSEVMHKVCNCVKRGIYMHCGTNI